MWGVAPARPTARAQGIENHDDLMSVAIPRVLFVDDEAQILSGLERSLRRHRRELDMAFANGGEAGLAAIAAGSFDLVVSDMRMPGVDGAALLGAVMEAQPAAMRIVLSGQADGDTALRAAAAAHRFISKPTGPDEIRAVLAHAVALAGRLPDPALRTTVGRVGQLPILARARAQPPRALARSDPPPPLPRP